MEIVPMLHSTVHRPTDNKPVTVDVDGEPQGVLISDPAGFRFVAVRLEAFDVDGQIFSSFEAAQAALRQAMDAHTP
jgi:hypothetical protein